jgi:hypothetical protein
MLMDFQVKAPGKVVALFSGAEDIFVIYEKKHGGRAKQSCGYACLVS